MHKKKYLRERALTLAFADLIQKIEEKIGLVVRLDVARPKSDTSTRDELLSPREASKQLGISRKTMANWRSNGTTSLQFVSVGRRVFYRQSDIDAFVKGSTMLSTSERRDRK